jgi:hypothetical protein
VAGNSDIAAVKSCIAKVIEASSKIGVTDGTGTHVHPPAVLAEIHGYSNDADWFFHAWPFLMVS